jgi:hypothetical protein
MAQKLPDQQLVCDCSAVIVNILVFMRVQSKCSRACHRIGARYCVSDVGFGLRASSACSADSNAGRSCWTVARMIVRSMNA